jgi:hypothetical protein
MSSSPEPRQSARQESGAHASPAYVTTPLYPFFSLLAVWRRAVGQRQ